MRNHHVTIDRTKTGFMAICTCRARSLDVKLWTEAQDWERLHLRTVERVKAHLRGVPTLASTYDYYRRMEKDPAVSAKEREQWKILADGLQHRLGVPAQDESMFEEAQ